MTAPLKIVVAEDNAVQLAYLTQLINALGFDAVPTENGMEALSLLQDSHAQILISDYHMPNLNGIELTQEIRKLGLDHYVYVIMMTGNEEEDIRNIALDVGVDDFLTKNLSPIVLKTRLRAATRQIHHAALLADRTKTLVESNARIQQDLHAAAAAQRQLLPDTQNEILGLQMTSAFVPSSFVSGDMFGCFPLNDTMAGFYAVDVSGHGVRASLMSVAIGYLVTADFFRSVAFCDNGEVDLAALVSNLNERFCTTESDDYFTMFCGVIDTRSGQLNYCQAAFPSPFYVNALGQTEAIGDGGFPVGMLPSATYENKMLNMHPGSSIVICSDAASEAENHDKEPFGLHRLRDIVATIPTIGTRNAPDRIVQALTQWRDGNTLEDDLTVVALEGTFSNDTHHFA